MTTAASAQQDWNAYGEKVASAFDGVHAAVIASHDPVAAAQVALAVARIQGNTRRVAIADLAGEVQPLQSLLTDDDPHGIADSFLYGVSLNKIARPVDSTGAVFLMPSGTEVVTEESIYNNERWRRLAAGFHQVGALLLVVAIPDTPGFAELCGFVGALLPVGEVRYPLPRGIPLVAPVPLAPAPVPTPPATPATPEEVEAQGRTRRAREAAAEDTAARRRKLYIMIALIFAAAITLGALWPRIAQRLPAPIAGMFGSTSADSGATTLTRVSASDTLADTTFPASSVSSAPLSVANPGDSLLAARFSIYYTSANTREAAMPDERIRALPSVAMTPVMDDGVQWYRLTIGAYTDRSEADALLQRMREEGLIGSGSIVRLPYALQLEYGVPAERTTARVASYLRRGILAYALRQQDGRAIVYTGAFETPSQATLLADSLRTTGIDPVLVLRTGRAF